MRRLAFESNSPVPTIDTVLLKLPCSFSRVTDLKRGLGASKPRDRPRFTDIY